MWVKVAGWVTGWPSVWGMYQTNNLGEWRSAVGFCPESRRAIFSHEASRPHLTSLRKRCFCNPTGILWRPFGTEQLCLWGIKSLQLIKTTHIYVCTSVKFLFLPAWHTLWNVVFFFVNSAVRKNAFFPWGWNLLRLLFLFICHASSCVKMKKRLAARTSRPCLSGMFNWEKMRLKSKLPICLSSKPAFPRYGTGKRWTRGRGFTNSLPLGTDCKIINIRINYMIQVLNSGLGEDRWASLAFFRDW